MEECSYKFTTIPYLYTTVIPKLDLSWVPFKSVMLLLNVAQLGENRLIMIAFVVS